MSLKFASAKIFHLQTFIFLAVRIIHVSKTLQAHVNNKGLVRGYVFESLSQTRESRFTAHEPDFFLSLVSSDIFQLILLLCTTELDEEQ